MGGTWEDVGCQGDPKTTPDLPSNPTHNGLVELGLDLAQQPIEGLPAEPELLHHATAAEGGAEVDVEEQGGVLLRLPAQRVIPVDDHQLAAQLLHP